MTVPDTNSLKEDSSYYEECGASTWLMDDHRWAFYIWQKFQRERQIASFSLIHADYHWDAVNVFAEHPEEIHALLDADDNRLMELVQLNERIRFDSFIAPAIIRGFIDEVHFFCKESDENELGLDDCLISRYGVTKYIHEDLQKLGNQNFQSPHIFDLCLDLFNRSNDKWYEGDLWSEEEIVEFIDVMENLIRTATLVTVSLSFGYSGTCDDTRRLATIVMPRILELRVT